MKIRSEDILCEFLFYCFFFFYLSLSGDAVWSESFTSVVLGSDPPIIVVSVPAASLCSAAAAASLSDRSCTCSWSLTLSLLLFNLFDQASCFSFSASAKYRCLRCSGYSSLYCILESVLILLFSFRRSLLYSCLAFSFLLKAKPWPVDNNFSSIFCIVLLWKQATLN